MLDFILILISIILFIIASIVAEMPILTGFFVLLFCGCLFVKFYTVGFKGFFQSMEE